METLEQQFDREAQDCKMRLDNLMYHLFNHNPHDPAKVERQIKKEKDLYYQLTNKHYVYYRSWVESE